MSSATKGDQDMPKESEREDPVRAGIQVSNKQGSSACSLLSSRGQMALLSLGDHREE